MNESLLAWADQCEAAYDQMFGVEYDRVEDERTLDSPVPLAKIQRVSETARQYVHATLPFDCAHCDAEPLDHYDLALGHEWEPKEVKHADD